MENGSGGANGNYTANKCGKIVRDKGTIGTHFSIVVTSGPGRERHMWPSIMLGIFYSIP